MFLRSIRTTWMLVFAAVAGITLSACYYDNEEDLYPGGSGCNALSGKYAAEVAPIIASRCLSCHSNATRQGGVILEGHDKLKIYAANGSLLGSIKHDRGFSAMPDGSPKMPDCEIGTIENWVNAGSPNN